MIDEGKATPAEYWVGLQYDKIKAGSSNTRAGTFVRMLQAGRDPVQSVSHRLSD